MRERGVRTYLKLLVEKRGGLCEPITTPGKRGTPDDLITWPDGIMQLVEGKTIGGRLSTGQKRDHARRARRRVMVRIVWTKEQAENYVMAEKHHWHGQILIPQCPDNFVN